MKPDSRPGERPVSGASGASAAPPLAFSSGSDAELRLIAEQAQMLTQSSGAAIAMLQGDVMRCRARAGATAPDLGAPLDTQSGLSGECVRGGVTLVCDDTEADPRVNLEVCRYLGIRSIAVLPISVEGNTVGVFEVFSSHPQAFSGNELAALESMRDLVISVIRPAPQSETPAVSPLSARAPRQSPAPPSPLSALFSDPEDDLLCEIEQRAPAQPQPDPARRAFELIKAGNQEAVARPAMPFANPDPGDDLICEIELRSHEPGAEADHPHPLSTFAPAPAQPPERPVSRKLIVLGIIVALAGLVWLRWCNHAQDAPKSISNISPKQVQGVASAAPGTANAAVKPVTPLPDAVAAAASSPDLPSQAAAKKSYSEGSAHSAPDPRPVAESRTRPAPSMMRKGPPAAYVGARDGPAIPPLATAKPQSSPEVASPPASSSSSPAAPASAAAEPAATKPQPPAARAVVEPPASTPMALPPSVAARPTGLTTRLSLSQAVVTTAADSGNGSALTPQAFRLLRDSAKAGDASAQLALAISYANGEGVRQSYPEALKWFNRAQAQGVLPRGERAEQAWTKVQQWAQAHPRKY